MKIRVTKDDFLKGKLVTPGWHPCIISSWDDTGKAGENAKNPGSSLTKVEFKVVDGPDKGTTLFTQFSEVAPAFMVPLIEAVSGKEFDKTKDVEFDVDAAAMKGKTVDVHVIRGSYNNKPKNEVDGYRKFSGRPAPVGG